MKSKTISSKIWPYAIGISITLVFFAGIATIVISSKLPVEKSDVYMMGYQEVDAKANEIINAQIAFDKKYKVEYINNGLDTQSTKIQYKIVDINSNPVNSANIKVVITRPNTHKYDQKLISPKVENGIYSFEHINLPKDGRWNIMAKIDVDNLERFYNIKADTRDNKITQY